MVFLDIRKHQELLFHCWICTSLWVSFQDNNWTSESYSVSMWKDWAERLRTIKKNKYFIAIPDDIRTLRHGNKILFVSPVFRGNLVILWDAECLKEYLKDKVSHQGRCHAVCTVLAFRKKEKQFWCHYVKHQGGGGGGCTFCSWFDEVWSSR